MAARGARAAGRARAAHRRAAWPPPRTIRKCRRALRRSRQGLESADGRRAQYPHRLSLHGRQRRSGSGARQRVGRPAARRDPRTFDGGRRRVAAGEPHDPDRVRQRLRPDRLGLHREPGAAGRQSHRRAATTRRASSANGWRCSRRSRRASRALLSWRIPRPPPSTTSCDPDRPLAPSLAIELVPSHVETAADIERAIESFARVPNGGLVMPPMRRPSPIAISSSRSRPAIACRRSTRSGFSSRPAVSCPTGPIRSTCSAGGILCRPHPARRQTRRPAGAGADQVRNDHQPQDRQGARPDRAARPAGRRRRGDRMKRREFITLLGGAAARGRSRRARSSRERMRRIGVLMNLAADDAEGQARLAAFTQALKQLGWSDGHNLRIDTRWATADDIRRHAAELVALAPDVLVAATGTATVAPLLQATRTVPIVFVTVIDPVGAGFVASLAQPGGNATGFTIYEYSMSGKWLELLKEIAPARDAGGGPSGSGRRLRDRAVRRRPDRGAVVRGGVEPGRCARCRRDRARRRGIRARVEWRPDRDGKRIGDRSSRADHHAGGPAPTARGLSRPLLRHGRRPDLLRARSRRPVPAARPATSIASSRARSRPTCRCRRRPSTSW